jgi:PKD repeat protein
MYKRSEAEYQDLSQTERPVMLRTRITLGLVVAVILTILIVAGCDELITQKEYITTAGNPTADFTLTPDSGCVPLVVKFKDASSGPVAQWFWKFGDGDTITTDSGHVTHTYDSVGSYIVTLVVYDSLDGSDDEVKERAVIVGQSIDSFYASPDSGCAGLEVSFHAVGYSGISAWKWRFDTDSSEILADSAPTHVYTEDGVHEVRLIVQGGCGVDTLFDTVTTVLCPQADFLVETLCGPRAFKFEDQSVPPDSNHPVNQWLWNFGNNKTCHQQDTTITYAADGAYVVSLTTTVAGGGSSTYTDTVHAYSTTTPDFGMTPTQSCQKSWRQFIVKFTDLTVGPVDSLVWWFGDGDTAWNDPAPAHAYIEPGIFTPELWVYRCESVVKRITPDGIVYADSLASPLFSVDPPDSGSTATAFTFADTSKGVITDWTWKIEGPGWDTTVHDRTTFTRSFVTVGTYKVRLTIGNLCSQATDSASFKVTE